jgi:signal transduction histidine kinase
MGLYYSRFFSVGVEMTGIQSARQRVTDALGKFSPTVRFLFITFGVLVLGAILFWAFNQAIYYFLARSYVEQIANAFDLDQHSADALVWLSFAAIVFFAGYAFSFNKRKRLIGALGFLALLVGHSLVLSRADNLMNKCYVVTRNEIKVLNRVGTDPQTGLTCRLLTPEMAERVRLYQGGKRPTQITGLPVVFFSTLTGEPIVWFTKGGAPHTIELFDLMGYSPRTGEELEPITRRVADEWTADEQSRLQEAKRIPPKRIPNPETTVFFDPITGQPKVWYWRSDQGDWEFYDNKGYHPRNGDPLQVVSREVLSRWQQEIVVAQQKKKDLEVEARAEADERDRLAREKAQADLLAKQAAETARQQDAQSGNDCDRLAANPTDARKVGDGVPWETLKLQVDDAINACTRAVQMSPSELRFQYQLGRALGLRDRKRAFEIETALTRQKYPAAFDNVGWMYLYDKKDQATAVQYFKTGSQLGDADAMVSLAEMIDRHYFAPENSYDMKLALWRQAAELGHTGAAKALENEAAKAEQQQIQQLNQQRAQQMMIQMIGGIIGGAIRH